MSFYLSQVLSYFLLPAVMFGLLWSGATSSFYKQRFWWSVLASVAGVAAYALLPYSQTSLLIIGAGDMALTVLLLVYGLWVTKPNRFLLLWQFVIVSLTAFMWARVAKLDMVTATSVINTELILNVAALLLGWILIGSVHYFTAQVMVQRSVLFKRVFFFVLILLALLPLSGEVLLSAMKLQILDLYQELLSYVSRVTNFFWTYAYVVMAMCLLPALVKYRHDIVPINTAIKGEQNAISRRKWQAKLIGQQRIVRGFLGSLVLIFAALLYWDAVASQPPTRSPAQSIELSADQAVHIAITDELKDGKLHRYQWIASDGKVVRFFVIDRYPGEMKFGVVFDACMLCGDAGYIQDGDQVICLACGVHIFIPSIGNPGGCNPIPIKEWSLKNNEIVISQAMLESGLQYFSDVVQITVTDPVNGDALTNIDAPFSYQFGGKTYFFSKQASYDAFRDNPWQYVNGSSALGGDQ